MNVPFSFVSYCSDNPARGRWDQAIVERLLSGAEWEHRVTFEERDEIDDVGRVIVFPCGHYVVDHDEADMALERLTADVSKMDWALIIATSDEAGAFPWERFDPGHNRWRLWVQTPNPGRAYPEGTRTLLLGSPTGAADMPTPDKTTDVFFSGQVTHDRRRECVDALRRLDLGVVLETEGFTLGLPMDDYLYRMASTRVAPCPAGAVTPETFRMYEALEAGTLPVVDGVCANGEPAQGFWQMLPGCDVGRGPVIMNKWWVIGEMIDDLVSDRWAALTLSWWQALKRKVVLQLRTDIEQWRALPPPHFDEQITAVVVTSPIPTHPSTAIIDETIASIRQRLPYSEIHILIDGVRPEQWHLADAYWEYAATLCRRYNSDPLICCFAHEQHLHQSGMFRRALERINTAYVLFVEHDTPLYDHIDFDDVAARMDLDEVAMMRFHHETHIHEDSAHLYAETEPPPGQPFLRTVQWSQRPHLASTSWYRDIMATYFGWGSRTMIEDVMHGVVQHHHTGHRRWVLKGWEKWRMAVWAPEPHSIKRSTHLDGRGDEPKYDMLVSYDHGRPDGAPPEGLV